MLEVRSLYLRRGGLPVLEEISFSLKPGACLLLTGRNGAGKSSLLAALTGLAECHRGQVIWDGKDVTRLPPHRRNGIALVPEGRVLAPTLTVDETLRLGAGRVTRAEVSRLMAQTLDRFPLLAGRRRQHAGTLSGGEAQMLSLARALMCRPRLLLLDEPTLGLSPAAAKAAFAILADLRREGIAIILTDQDSRAAHALADRVMTLANRSLYPTTATQAPKPRKETTCSDPALPC